MFWNCFFILNFVRKIKVYLLDSQIRVKKDPSRIIVSISSLGYRQQNIIWPLIDR